MPGSKSSRIVRFSSDTHARSRSLPPFLTAVSDEAPLLQAVRRSTETMVKYRNKVFLIVFNLFDFSTERLNIYSSFRKSRFTLDALPEIDLFHYGQLLLSLILLSPKEHINLPIPNLFWEIFVIVGRINFYSLLYFSFSQTSIILETS